MKKIVILNIALFMFGLLEAQQVPLNTIVEHFTNTKCSVCASRNPGFYNNLNTQSSITYLAIHPSSPYPSCILSQQNTIDNDARTNYYAVYGSTPRLAINGTVIPVTANYASTALFTPFLGLTSSFELQVNQNLKSSDSIETRVTIKKVDTSSLSSASLFMGIVEDTVFVNGGNGELEHYHVLRKSPLTSSGVSVVLPNTIGDSIVVSKAAFINTSWNASRIFGIAILQESTSKQVIQTAKSSLLDASILSISTQKEIGSLVIYPNPASSYLVIDNSNKLASAYMIYDITGHIIQEGSITDIEKQMIDINALTKGIYLIEFRNEKYNHLYKFIKE